MSEAQAIRGLVRLVAEGLRRRDSEPELIARLIAIGIPEEQAPELLAAVRQAIQAGVQAEFTGGLSAQDGPPPDPLLAEAFRFGRESFRSEIRKAWQSKLALPLAVVLLLSVALAVWWLRR